MTRFKVNAINEPSCAYHKACDVCVCVLILSPSGMKAHLLAKSIFKFEIYNCIIMNLKINQRLCRIFYSLATSGPPRSRRARNCCAFVCTRCTPGVCRSSLPEWPPFWTTCRPATRVNICDRDSASRVAGFTVRIAAKIEIRSVIIGMFQATLRSSPTSLGRLVCCWSSTFCCSPRRRVN